MPLVPEQGTVGASGDLAPLAHLALGMMGEGKMWSPKSGWADSADVSWNNNTIMKLIIIPSTSFLGSLVLTLDIDPYQTEKKILLFQNMF